MNLCSDDHEEVCFKGRQCPVCNAMSECNSVQDDLDKANERITELEQELTDANNQ